MNLLDAVKLKTCLSCRVVREGKERRRKWAQRLTPRPSKITKDSKDRSDTKTQLVSMADSGLLPDDVVEMLAAREKYDFSFSFSKYV